MAKDVAEERTATDISEFLSSARLVVDLRRVRKCDADRLDGAAAAIGLDMPELPSAAGAASAVRVVFNKSAFNKSSLNKNKGTNKLAAPAAGGTLIPTAPILRLHRFGPLESGSALPFDWANIGLAPPPGPDHTRLETAVLLAMQNARAVRRMRREDIVRQATLDVSDFTRPLGIDGLAGYEATESLFLEILTVCEYVGLYYKAVFGRIRPNQFEPRLRPMLPNPAHEAYPSNHSFQCYSIAYAFNTILPEHPGTNELGIAALSVAQNREWAGLHYPSDTAAGKYLARCFAPFLADAFSEHYQAVQNEWF